MVSKQLSLLHRTVKDTTILINFLEPYDEIAGQGCYYFLQKILGHVYKMLFDFTRVKSKMSIIFQVNS